MDDLVAIAKVARPHGLRGEVAADVLTDFPERFQGLESVVILAQDRSPAELTIEGFRFQKGRVFLKFAGLDTVESVEPLRNAEICVPEDEAVELEAGEFYDWELEGCRVVTVDGTELGTVRELMRTGGTEILVVQGTEKDYLVPFAGAICTEVDIENELITIDPPDGLLEF